MRWSTCRYWDGHGECRNRRNSLGVHRLPERMTELVVVAQPALATCRDGDGGILQCHLDVPVPDAALVVSQFMVETGVGRKADDSQRRRDSQTPAATVQGCQ